MKKRNQRALLAAFAATALIACGGAGADQATTTTVIQEDDPRWDCRVMGNHICGSTIFFNMGGELHGFDLHAPNRPGCFVEPSNTPEGFEVIFRPDISQGDDLGFEVRCP